MGTDSSATMTDPFMSTSTSLAKTRTLFLRMVSVCYAMAFMSLYTQIPGLYGPNGILPAKSELTAAAGGGGKMKSMMDKPTLLWFAGELLGLSVDLAMDLVCLVGTFLALLIAAFPFYGGKVFFFILWALYLSVYHVGSTFMHFQWDILMLEVGFLCIVVAPWIPLYYDLDRPWDPITISLARWLVFRMMFASGVVKLTSNCPMWWGLSAMPLHYESQCIPHPVAWYAFHTVPEWVHKLTVAGTFFVEIPATFLFYAPTERLRKLAYLAQIILMIVIMATGNFNFFNFLFIALCIPLMDDSWLDKKKRKSSSKFVKIFDYVVLAICAYGFCYYFMTVNEIKITFTKGEFAEFVAIATPAGILVGGGSLVLAVLNSLRKILSFKDGFWRILWNFCVISAYAFVAFILFFVSLPIFTRGLDQPVPDFVPKVVVRQARDLNHRLDAFQIINSYGLFRHMTGVGGRPEVIVEGSNDMRNWKEYHFLYKPGNISSAPRFILPHQPRLDWQMWFAALGTYHHNPWFISLSYRLLTGQSEVLQLMDVKNNPFPESPPKYIRASLYHYHFTPYDSKSKNWWSRKRQGEYLPIFTADHEPLLEYLEKVGIFGGKKKEKITNLLFMQFLEWMRTKAVAVEPHVPVWSVSWLILPMVYQAFAAAF